MPLVFCWTVAGLFSSTSKVACIAYGEKTGPGHCPERQLIAQRPSMINQARGALFSGEIPGILNICGHCEPIARCAVDFYAASLS